MTALRVKEILQTIATLSHQRDRGESARRQIRPFNHRRGRPDSYVHTCTHPGIDHLPGMRNACAAVVPTLESHRLLGDDAAAR